MEAAHGLSELSKQVVGFIYPNEIEIHWSILIVVYPYITGLVAGAFILASLVKVFNVKELQPTYRLALLTALAFLLWDSLRDPTRCFSPPISLRQWPCSALFISGI